MKKRSGPTVFLGTVTVILAITVLFFFCKGRDIVQKSIDAALSQDDTRLSALQQQIDELEKALAKMQGDADKKQRESEEKEAEWAKERQSYEEQIADLKKQVRASKPIKSNTKSWTPAEGKVAYLTFDDGPSVNTDKILSILEEKDVKATWFVVGSGKDEELKRIYEAGHAIGLHTYSHDYAKCYKDEDSFYRDLDQIEQHVYDVIGIHSRIMRFPGGLSNHVSMEYNQGIMSRLAVGVLQRGYTFFDWNAANNDALKKEPLSKQELLDAVKTTVGTKNCVCILMHDSKSRCTTPDALPEIIDWLRDQGYRFDVLTADMPYLAQTIAN